MRALKRPAAAADNRGVARVVLLVVLVAGIAALAVSHARGEAAEERLGAVASELAGRPVHVHCQGVVGAALDVGSEAGTVSFDPAGRPSDTTDLKRATCGALRSFRREAARPEFDCVARGVECPERVLHAVWAVHTLAHESAHLGGEPREAFAECRALQTTAWTAVRLGAAPLQGQALAGYVWLHMYPELPDDYRSPECRDGGRLDLRPAVPLWP